MAAPVLQKTWQGGSTAGGTQFVNVVITGTTPRDTLWAIKNAMVNFFAVPWTVVGSSDGSTSGMDAVDRWVTPANIVYRTTAGTPLSWIVLRQTGIGASHQIILYVDDLSATDPNRQNVNIMANATGFGTASGFLGLNGSTTTIPTSHAASRNFSLNGSSWLGAEGASPTQMVLTCISSTDGECTRIIASKQSTGVPITALGFEKARLPPSDWTIPAVMYIFKSTVASGLSALRWEVMAANVSAQNVWGNQDLGPSFVATPMTLQGPMFSTFEVVDLAEEDRPNPMLYPCAVFGNPGYALGYPVLQHFGTLFDWYWCSRDVTGKFLADLDTIPLAGDRTFVCVGDCVYGWLDDSATDLSYT